MLQSAAVTHKSPEPISHAFLCLFLPFPTSSCSYTMYIYLHRIHSSILVPTKIHYLQIFYKLGNFLKVKRWAGERLPQGERYLLLPPGSMSSVSHSLLFCVSTPFPRARAGSCSEVSLRAVLFMPLPRYSMSPYQLYPDVGSRLEEQRGNIKH